MSGLTRSLPLESLLVHPLHPFGGRECHPCPKGETVALGNFLISNRPCFDGNKRTGNAYLEVMLGLSGSELHAPLE